MIKEVLSLIDSNEPLDMAFGVSAPTGTGKTTSLIYEIYKARKPVRIMVTQPTTAATRSIFNWMKSRYGKEINFGYSAEGDVKYTDKDNIIYVTAGHMENAMFRYFENGRPKGDIDICDILVLDEAHRGALDQATIVALWKEALCSLKDDRTPVKVPKLIFMSATLDMDAVGFPNNRVVTLAYKPYPITITYNDESYDVNSRDLYPKLAEKIFDIHANKPIPMNSRKNKESGVKYPGYDVWVVFCPGREEVLIVANELTKRLNDQTDEEKEDIPTEVCAVYGTQSADENMKIFTPPKAGVRRFIIGTPLIEASVTVPFVTYIFDSMMEKYNGVENTNGQSFNGPPRLITGIISQSSAEQRAGRTGRVCPGEVFRMMTKEKYDSLSYNRLPEIQRIPLTSVAINFLSVGLDPAKVFEGMVNEGNLRAAIAELELLEMYKDGEVTEIGKFAPRFPLSVRCSAFLYWWIKSDIDGIKLPIFPGIVITCLINCFGEGYYYYPRLDRKSGENASEFNKRQSLENIDSYEKYYRKYAGRPSGDGGPAERGRTDLEVLIVMWHYLLVEFGGVSGDESFVRDRRIIKAFCAENWLNGKKISELFNCVSKVKSALSRHLRKPIITTVFSPVDGVINATPILQRVYPDQRYTRFSNKGKRKTNVEYYNATTKLFGVTEKRAPITMNSELYGEIVSIYPRLTLNKKQEYLVFNVPLPDPDGDTPHIPEPYDVFEQNDSPVKSVSPPKTGPRVPHLKARDVKRALSKGKSSNDDDESETSNVKPQRRIRSSPESARATSAKIKPRPAARKASSEEEVVAPAKASRSPSSRFKLVLPSARKSESSSEEEKVVPPKASRSTSSPSSRLKLVQSSARKDESSSEEEEKVVPSKASRSTSSPSKVVRPPVRKDESSSEEEKAAPSKASRSPSKVVRPPVRKDESSSRREKAVRSPSRVVRPSAREDSASEEERDSAKVVRSPSRITRPTAASSRRPVVSPKMAILPPIKSKKGTMILNQKSSSSAEDS
jgi:hypothetical protein